MSIIHSLAFFEALYQIRKIEYSESVVQMIFDLENSQNSEDLFLHELDQCIGFVNTKLEECNTEINELQEGVIVTNEELPLDLSVRTPAESHHESNIPLGDSASSNESYNLNTQDICQDEDLVCIGPNGTTVNIEKCKYMKWDSAASATRQLLLLVFSKETLATQTLSGRPSPAFIGRDRPKKCQLDPNKVNDIVYAVINKFNVTERDVRATITTKCADIAKIYKKRQQT